MAHEHIAQYAPKMLGYLRKCFPRLDDADREDAVQTVLVKMLASNADIVPTDAYLRQAAKNSALDILKQRERGWFKSLGSEVAKKELASLSPLEADMQDADIAAEINRRGRQKLLLSDILQEYAQRCELQNMQTQREIYERKLRGQEVKIIESSMDVTRASIDKHLQRARDWISNRMQQADVEKSVFQTFLRPKRDVPAIPDTVAEDVPRNFHEVLMRVVNEVGALCPSDERLARFEQQPQAVEFSDLRYHIQEAQCPLCQAR